MTHFRKGLVKYGEGEPRTPMIKSAARDYDFCSLGPRTGFTREFRFSFPRIFGKTPTYEEAKEQLDDPSRRIRKNAVLRIIDEYNLDLTQRVELAVIQDRGYACPGRFSRLVYAPVKILVANAAKSKAGFDKIRGKPYEYATLSHSEFEVQYPDRYDAVATLENIASTSTYPNLRRMAREAILDSDVLLRLATSSYEDTAVYASRVLGLYVHDASHWIGMSSDKSLQLSTPLHLVECSDSGFVFRVDDFPHRNVFGQELDAALVSIQNTNALIAFLDSLCKMNDRFSKKGGVVNLLSNEAIQSLLERKPELDLVKQLEKIVEGWIGRGVNHVELSVRAIINGLNATEEGKVILKTMVERLNVLFKRGAAISARIREQKEAESIAWCRIAADYSDGGAEYGYAPSGYLGDSGWRY